LINVLFLILVIFILFIIGLPIAIAIGFPSMIFLWFNEGVNYISIQRIVGGLHVYSLLAIPLFILAANIMNEAKVTKILFDFCDEIVGSIKGGLGHVNVLASMIFAGMSGCAAADAGGLGLIEIEAMRGKNYPDNFSVGITAASSIIGPIIPPSLHMIVYAVAADASIGRLFAGGLIPGILMGGSLSIMIILFADKFKLPPVESKINIKRIFHSFKKAFFAIFTPLILLGGIFFGIFTPTEGAGVAILYTIVIGFIVYRSLTLKKVHKALIESTKISVKTLFIIGFSSLFSWILASNNIPQILFSSFSQGINNYYKFMFLVNFLLLVTGCFLEPVSSIIIFVPIFLPFLKELGIDYVHFGVIMVLNLLIGALTPPFGGVLFVLSSAANVKVEDVAKDAALFIIPILIVLALIVIFPQIVLFLPNLIYGK